MDFSEDSEIGKLTHLHPTGEARHLDHSFNTRGIRVTDGCQMWTSRRSCFGAMRRKARMDDPAGCGRLSKKMTDPDHAGSVMDKVCKFSGESLELCLELVFGDTCSDDLILHLAIFEKEEQGNGAHIVFHSKLPCFVHVDFAHFGHAIQLAGDLVNHGADHFARSAPFSPKVHKDREVGVDHFRLEIHVGKFESHASSLYRESTNVKGHPAFCGVALEWGSALVAA